MGLWEQFRQATTPTWNPIEAQRNLAMGMYPQENSGAARSEEQQRDLIRMMGGDPGPTSSERQAALEADPTYIANKQAKEFESASPGMKRSLYEGAQKKSQYNLADRLEQTRSGANRRGLLYGGMRAGAEQGERASAGAGLASAKGAINTSVQNQIDQMRKGAISGGLQAYGNAMSAAQEDYQNAMNKYKNKNAMIGQIAGGVGAVVGGIYGGAPGASAGYAAGTTVGSKL